MLRGQLKFAGVVISDDLEMGAIRKQFDLHDTVVRAVNAGVDVLLFSNTAAYSPDLADKVRGDPGGGGGGRSGVRGEDRGELRADRRDEGADREVVAARDRRRC